MHTLREWGDSIANELSEWQHAPPETDAGRYKGFTLLQHDNGALAVLETSNGSARLDTKVPETSRLVITTQWPFLEGYGHFAPYDYSPGQATASATSSVRAIANGFSRRFLDDYAPAWAERQASMERTIEEHAATLALVNELGAALGKEPIKANRRYGHEFHVGPLLIRSTTSIDLKERSVTVQQAKDICLYLAGKAYIVSNDQLFDPDHGWRIP